MREKKNWLCILLGVLVFTVCCLPACAEGTDGDGDETLAPYFFIEGTDPSIDCLPLKGTEATVDIASTIAEIRVVQTYANEGKRPISASYVFPASTQVTVHGMTMEVGGTTVSARIREKEEAKEEFEEAKSEGKSASLLEEQRPNVFTMDVANIMPGDTVRIELHYTELLTPEEGTYQFVFPTVVGPRYARQSEGENGSNDDWTASPYLEEGSTSEGTYDITVHLSAEVPITDLACRSHETEMVWTEESEVQVTLSDTGTFAGDRDYILEYRLTGEEMNSGLMLYEGETENYFLLTIQPPERYEPEDIPPREYIFVVDVSGSMYGYPLDTAKELIRNLVRDLREEDCFNVILFSDIVSEMSLESVAATQVNMECAMTLIDRQTGGGGTELASALDDAVNMPAKEGTSRSIVVVTDGYISNEEEIFARIRDNLGNTSFFSFGIGSSVNRYLVEGIADAGMGEAYVVTEESKASEAAERFRTHIEAPVLTDIRVEFDGFDAYDIVPGQVSTLFARKPIVLSGKWRGEPSGVIRLSGKTGNQAYVQEIQASEAEPSEGNRAIRYLWARKRVEELTDYGFRSDDKSVKEEVTAIGLDCSMLTPYTSFVAVLDTVRNPDGESTDVDQPSPLPSGVSGFAVGGGYLIGAEPSDRILLLLSAPALLIGILLRRKKGIEGVL